MLKLDLDAIEHKWALGTTKHTNDYSRGRL
jgi:hypothetical protein